MNARTFLFLVAIVSGNRANGQAVRVDSRPHPAVASTRLQLHAEVGPTSANRGVPIIMSLRLRNGSSGAVRIADTSWEYDYELVVTDASGKEPPRTELGRKLLAGDYVLLHSESVDLKSGQEIEASLDVTRIYQLIQPGTYYARATRSRVFPDSADEATLSSTSGGPRPVEKVFSNSVQFTVLP
jgi:hypothetical protein